MCGIYGWQLREGHEFTTAQKAIMSLTLAENMAMRGRDSFGAALWTPETENQLNLIKHLGKITEKGADVFELSSRARSALVHTRQATTGAVTIPNAHPFEIGDILGVHNGVVYNHDELIKKYDRKYEVDSQHIFSHISEGLPLNDITAYGAIVYARKSEQYKIFRFAKTPNASFNVARIYTYKSKSSQDPNFSGIIWASTLTAIREVCERLGMDYWSVITDDDKWYEIREGNCFDTTDKLTLGTFRSNYTSTGSSSSSGSHTRTVGYGVNDDDDVERYQQNWRDRRVGGNNSSSGVVRSMGGMTSRIPDIGRRSSTEYERESKKARKRRIKAQRRERNKVLKQLFSDFDQPMLEKLISMSADPVAKNLKKNVPYMGVVYRPQIPKQGEQALPAIRNYLCKDCNCQLTEHMWGWCCNVETNCTAQNKGKSYICNVPNIPLCGACGCFLSDDIHSATSDDARKKFNAELFCMDCMDFCGSSVIGSKEDMQRARNEMAAEALANRATEGEGEGEITEEIAIPQMSIVTNGVERSITLSTPESVTGNMDDVWASMIGAMGDTVVQN